MNLSSKIFLPQYQIDFLKNNDPILLVEKSRQIGFSFASMQKILKKMLTKPNATVLYVSTGLRASQKFMNDFKRYIRILRFIDPIGYANTDKICNASVVTLHNGSRMIILPCDPDAFAGYTADLVIIDEAAVMPYLEQCIKISVPTLAVTGGQLVIISTHRGKHNYFCKYRDLINDGKILGGKVMSVPITKALDDGFIKVLNDKRLRAYRAALEYQPDLEAPPLLTNKDYYNQCRESAADEDAFNQEYLAIPLNNNAGGGFIEDDIIKCQDITESSYTSDCKIFVGIDVGGQIDSTSVAVFAYKRGDNPRLINKFIIEADSLSPQVQFNQIKNFLGKYKITAGFVDASNASSGGVLASLIQKQFRQISPLFINKTNMLEMWSFFSSLVKTHNIVLPFDNQIVQELTSVMTYTRRDGTIGYSLPRSAGSHCDLVASMAIGLLALKPDYETGLLKKKSILSQIG